MLGIIAPDVARAAGLTSTLALRVFDRAQEHQSDVTGTKVLADLGLNPMGMHSAIALLERDAQLQQKLYGGARETMIDYWLRTHPVSSERMQLIGMAASMAPMAAAPRQTDRRAFLRQLDGLLMDDGPAQGIVDGNIYRHPGLKLVISAPADGRLLNGSKSLVLLAPGGGKAILRLVNARGTTPELFAAAWKSEVGKLAPPPAPQQVALPSGGALYGAQQVSVQGRQVEIGLQVAPWPNGYHAIILTTDPAGGATRSALTQFRQSLRPWGPADATAFRCRVLRVVSAGPGDTIASLASRMAYTDQQEARFRALNGLAANATLRSGDPAKVILWQKCPGAIAG